MRWFDGLTEVSEIKKAYYQAAMHTHPDHGGDEETFKALNNEYEEALRSLEGQKFARHDGQGFYTYHYNTETEQEIMDIIDALLRMKMEDVEIILIGVWIWVGGNTRPYAKELGKKGLGLTWMSHRTKWAWKPKWSKSTRSTESFESLADRYGSRRFENDDRNQDNDQVSLTG